MAEENRLTENLEVTEKEESRKENIFADSDKINSQPNFYIRTSERPDGNFIIFNSEILRLKDENGNPLDDKTIGHFVRLFSLASGNWNYKQKGTATITNSCINTVGARDKKLKELGYLEEYIHRDEFGRFAGRTYILNETLDKDIRNNDSIPQEVLNRINNKPNMENPETDFSKMKNSATYIENNVNQNQLNKRIYNISLGCNSKESSSKSSKEVSNYYTCNMSHDNSLGINTCSSCNRNTEDVSLIIPNNYTSSNGTCSSTGKSNSKPGRKSKAELLKNKVLGIVENERDDELRENLINYVNAVFESGKKLGPTQFKSLLEQLEELSNGKILIKRKIVKNAIPGAYLNFIPLNSRDFDKIRQIEHEYDKKLHPEKYELARDENGNLLVF